MTGEGQEPVGTLAEEAAKLMHALQDWARESGGDYAEAGAAAAGTVGSAAHRLNEHIATDAAECTYCPLCRVISAVRETSPEVRQHLSVAATSLVNAAAGLLATSVPDPSSRRRQEPVQKIDLDDLGDDIGDDTGEND